ncbi:MAG: HD domain-containing protein [Gemmatimonadetes bacterium]|nr:HD domain-containing protein [Gemmatimonadota bacterium]
MKHEVFLRSRVARRVVGLFLLCAVAPIGALASLSYQHLRRNLEAQAEDRLHRAARSASVILLDRLTSVTREVTRTAGDVDGHPIHQQDGVRWVAVARPDSWRSIVGPVPVVMPVPIPQPVAGRVAAGKPWITVLPGPTPTVILVVRLATDSAAALVAAIEAERLWGAPGVNPLVAEGIDGCVLGPGETPLHGFGEGCPSAEDADLVMASSTVFLGYEFGAPSWQVQVAEPRAVVEAPMAGFRSRFFWVATLTLAIVFILANVQIRRSMEPLDALTEGTRKVAAGDLSHRVTVRGTDEFSLVASSFNGMAASLDRQIGLLRSIQSLNEAALISPVADGVLARSLETLGLTFPDAVVIAARQPLRPGHPWRARLVVDRACAREATFRPTQEALEQLRRTAAPTTRRGLGELDHFAGLGVDRDWHVTVAPLASHDELVGFLAVTRAGLPFDAEDLTRVHSLAGQTAVALANARLVERLDEVGWGALKALARTIDANSPWTAGHSERVTGIAIQIGKSMGLDERELELLHRGGLLHDIGKIGVPASVLDKAGPLTPEERAVVERHPIIGAEILAPMPIFAGVVPLVRWHHEALNGTGYPDRLAGDRIPRNVRVLTVADVFDALTSERPYRAAWRAEDALRLLEEGIGSKFDGEAVRAWAAIVRGVPNGNWAAALPRFTNATDSISNPA